MKAPADGWDRDEREVLELDGLVQELDAVRARHAIDSDADARILARVRREARPETERVGGSWRWALSLAATAALVVAGTVWMVNRGTGSAPGGNETPQPTTAGLPPAVEFHLTLEKPALKISPSTLVWRGPGLENPLLSDLKPAYDAFRASNYQGADARFAALSAKYPASIEVAFYLGVSRLFAGNIQGALASLTAAERLADSSFAWDVAWYLAVVEERAANLAAARARLAGLCAQPDVRAKTACAALAGLAAGRGPGS